MDGQFISIQVTAARIDSMQGQYGHYQTRQGLPLPSGHDPYPSRMTKNWPLLSSIDTSK